MWYDINQTLSYNALFNFIIGNRGGGKTYGAKQWAIKDFLKNGNQFVYMRRHKQEFKENKQFFDPFGKTGAFPGIDLEVKGNKYFVDDKLAGFSMPLSTAKVSKSTEFPNVTKIIFDEFILDKGVYHYLPDEVTAFLEAYETIARMRDVKVFFLANAITISNPYFSYFNITLPYGSTIARRGDLLIQLVQDREFIETKEKTRFGQIVAGTKYADYSIGNKFLRDSNEFIMPKSGNCNYQITLKYMNQMYGLWVDMSRGLMFMSEDIDPSCKLVIATTTDDHQPNTLLFHSTRKSPIITNLFKQFDLGNLRFENIRVKNAFMEILKMSY